MPMGQAPMGQAPAQVPVLSAMANRPQVQQPLPAEYNVQMPVASYPAPTQVIDQRPINAISQTPQFLASPPHLPHLGAQEASSLRCRLLCLAMRCLRATSESTWKL